MVVQQPCIYNYINNTRKITLARTINKEKHQLFIPSCLKCKLPFGTFCQIQGDGK